ncbi:MAG: VWA domain-containing protein [Terriglobia bacterium]
MSTLGRISCNIVITAVLFPVVIFLLLVRPPPGLAFQESAPVPKSDQAELTSHDTQPAFKLKTERNLVTVRVVVRDSKGNALGNFHKEDFRLLDNGKPQVITQFAVEAPQTAGMNLPVSELKSSEGEAQPENTNVSSVPQRYIALYFDDVHMKFEDIARTRDAASGYLASALQPGDRVGIFTSSGQRALDFTDDRDKIHDALFALQSRPIVPHEINPCPDISPYQAFLIVERREARSLEIATEEALSCQFNNDPRFLAEAQQSAESAAARVLSFDETESEASLRELELLVRRMGVVPGQRNIVLVSPGFMTETQTMRIGEIVDRALRLKVVVNTLDSQGLYVAQPFGDASQDSIVLPRRMDLMGNKAQIRLDEYSRNSDVLAEVADSTGGVFFHNSNDLNEGFRRVGSLPGAYYVLAFSPQNLKLNGKYHALKVSLTNAKGFSLQARHGYYAPKQSADAATQASEEIQEAVFSQDELNELPIDMHTQFFRVSEADAKLSVLTHVDLRFVRFRKQAGRNLDNLVFVTVLFDHDGKYVAGQEKTLEMRLLDTSLERFTHSGITMKIGFDVKPGAYIVRQVVREAEGAKLSGLSRPVEIPY